MISKLGEEDSDFGKVRNDDPSVEFAFELRGNPMVPSIHELSEGCRVGTILAVDDYGAPVTSVPLGATSNAFFFDLMNHSIELKTEAEAVPIRDLLHGLPRGIVNCLDELDLPNRRKRKLKSLRMSRFYYCAPDRWWTFTHG